MICIHWNPKNSNFLLCAGDNKAIVLDLEQNKIISNFKAESLINKAQWSVNGNLIAASSQNKVILWNFEANSDKESMIFQHNGHM